VGLVICFPSFTKVSAELLIEVTLIPITGTRRDPSGVGG
jgi:hypothetical protein